LPTNAKPAALLSAVILGGAVLFGTAAPAAAAPAPVGPAGQTCPETRANLAGQHLTAADKLPDLTCADLHGAVLDGLDLTQVELRAADLRGASLRRADLGQATLTHADLRGARFEDADLSQADLDGTDARDASFAGADLTQADLTGADLRGADFITASMIQADLSDADLRGAKIWFTLSIQATTSGARVNLTDPRTFQLGLLGIVYGLYLCVRATIASSRGRGGRGSLRRGVVRAVLFAAIGGFAWLIVGMLLSLQFIVAGIPLLIGAALVFASGLLNGGTPRTGPAGRPMMSPIGRMRS
jgi:uncharacterized protein YjbI with pentapeptide repeats